MDLDHGSVSQEKPTVGANQPSHSPISEELQVPTYFFRIATLAGSFLEEKLSRLQMGWACQASTPDH